MNKRGITSGRHQAAQQIKAAVREFLEGEPTAALRNHKHAIDDPARKALARLSTIGRNSDRMTAAEAIVETLPPEAWPSLFADCVIAEWRARSHPGWNNDARSILERADEADKALAAVARFLCKTEVVGDPSDPAGEALGILHTSIDMRRRLAGDHQQLYSRNKTPEAARAHGVGWIRDTLESICRRYGATCDPRHVAIIATAALGMGDVTVNMVDKAPSLPERLAVI